MQNQRSRVGTSGSVLVVLVLTACTRSAAPPSTLAPAYIAPSGPSPRRLTPIHVHLTLQTQHPRQVTLTVTGPGGLETQRSACDTAPSGYVACEDPETWYEGPGRYSMGFEYVSVAGAWERAQTALVLHGDETEFSLTGEFGDDASLSLLETWVLRVLPAGVALVEIAPPQDGGLPHLELRNDSEMTFRAMSDGEIHSGLERYEEDGTTSWVLRGFGCGMVRSEVVTIAPGDRHVVDSARGHRGLAPGRYRVDVILHPGGEDPEGVRSDHTWWRVSYAFEVAPYEEDFE